MYGLVFVGAAVIVVPAVLFTIMAFLHFLDTP